MVFIYFRYHTFDEFSQQCLVAENMTDMLTQLIEHYDAQGKLARAFRFNEAEWKIIPSKSIRHLAM